MPRLTILCIIHRNLAKCCLATHLPWIILFDRQVKHFSLLIFLLLLAEKVGIRASHWEASQWGCLIEALVEFDPGRQRLKAENLRRKRQEEWEMHGDRDLTVKTCKLFVSNPLKASGRRALTLVSVMESSPELLGVSSPTCKGNRVESSGAACAPEPKVEVSLAECFWHYSACKSLNAKIFLRQRALQWNC